jgi:hypothetical protein
MDNSEQSSKEVANRKRLVSIQSPTNPRNNNKSKPDTSSSVVSAADSGPLQIINPIQSKPENCVKASGISFIETVVAKSLKNSNQNTDH